MKKFFKSLTDLAIKIKWYNLPKKLGGFKDYYKDYDNGINNDSFKVGITCLTDFQFHPFESENVQNFDLFNSLNDDKLSNQSYLNNININKLKIKPIYEDIDIDNFDSRSKLDF